jgi:hypothetical protein
MGVFGLRTLAPVWITVLVTVAACSCTDASALQSTRAGARAIAKPYSQWRRPGPGSRL